LTARRLILIRHGVVAFESRDFRDSPRGRQWNPPLSETGLEQARLLATDLLELDRPVAVLCSPFRRCLETVAPFVEATGIEPVFDEDLGEVFVGSWEGESFEQILDSDEEVARRFREREPIWMYAPGGERGSQLRARVVASVERGLADNPEGDVYVFAHGGVINAYLVDLLGIGDQDMFFLPENTSLNIVRVDGEERSLRFINDTRHLLGMRNPSAQGRPEPRPRS
jgi:2,3-bisphosphoglycerate-dependent phosphoglycerate mutase